MTVYTMLAAVHICWRVLCSVNYYQYMPKYVLQYMRLYHLESASDRHLLCAQVIPGRNAADQNDRKDVGNHARHHYLSPGDKGVGATMANDRTSLLTVDKTSFVHIHRSLAPSRQIPRYQARHGQVINRQLEQAKHGRVNNRSHDRWYSIGAR